VDLSATIVVAIDNYVAVDGLRPRPLRDDRGLLTLSRGAPAERAA